jgi:hypothetical protein
MYKFHQWLERKNPFLWENDNWELPTWARPQPLSKRPSMSSMPSMPSMSSIQIEPSTTDINLTPMEKMVPVLNASRELILNAYSQINNPKNAYNILRQVVEKLSPIPSIFKDVDPIFQQPFSIKIDRANKLLSQAIAMVKKGNTQNYAKIITDIANSLGQAYALTLIQISKYKSFSKADTMD